MPRKLERFALLIALAASPLWLPNLSTDLTGTVRMTLASALKPAFSTLHATRQSFRNLSWGILRGVELQEENQALKRQVQTLVAHEETHRQLFAENARLRALARFQSKSPWKLIPTEVIGRELGPWSRTLLLDKGSRHGIGQGMAVITPTGLVGRIGEVGSGSSRVILITDVHFRVAGRLAKAKVSGLLEGIGSGECRLTYLPLEAEIEPDELILTAGGKSFSPPGIPVGKAGKVRVDASQLHRSVRVRPAVNLATVEEVLVVAWPHPDSG